MDYLTLADAYSDYGAAAGGGSAAGSLIGFAAQVIALWFMFMKANEPGWKSIIPFLNLFTMFELAYGSGWKMLLLLVPGLNIVLYFAYNIRLAQSYNAHWAFGLGLAFLPTVFYLILAFGPFQYVGSTSKFL